MDVSFEWTQTPEAGRIAQAVQNKAWVPFLAKYPNADKSKFVAQVDFAEDRTATAEIYFKVGPDNLKSVFVSDSKYWSKAMKNALWRVPYQLSPNNESLKPVPAVNFSKNIKSNIGEILNKKQKIYITPTDFFTTQYREIFKDTQIKFTTSKCARKWLRGPHMSFWPQQLNFALWCATTGSGISRDILSEGGNSNLNLSPQLRSFYLFHVYFTTRRILYEMGGMQNFSSLPDDPNFDNKYDEAS